MVEFSQPNTHKAFHVGHLRSAILGDVLARMLAHPKVRAARVSTEKPDVYPDCDAVGVQAFRAKPGVL